MREKKTILAIFIALINLIPAISFSQDVIFNKPSKFENEHNNIYNPSELELQSLEKQHKSFMENGDMTEAGKIKNKMDMMIPAENKFMTQTADAGMFLIPENSTPPETDWLSANPVVLPGGIRNDSDFNKKIDIKRGEDNNLYACVCGYEFGATDYSMLTFMKSTNDGKNWTSVKGLGFFDTHISNISFTVESRNNLIADSTRLIVFYTASDNSGYTNATLNYLNVRVDGQYKYGLIATPSAGNSFGHVSVVSDGAFYQNATYFGVICTELDNTLQNTQSLRFFRTIDWGATWTGVNLNTGYNDFNPSADYKEGSSDSICIALERRFSPSESQIRVIKTSWSPSVNFNTVYLTSGNNIIYEKPSLTIKQNPSADSMLISCTKNNIPYYHFSKNGGTAWVTDNPVDPANPSNIIFTYCSSAQNGDSPFTICWQNKTSDSVNVRRGALGNFSQPKYKVNGNKSFNRVSPVCANLFNGNINSSALIYYYTYSSTNMTYFCGESNKVLKLKVIPEAFYDPTDGQLNFADSLKVYIRKAVSPYTIIDSCTSKLFQVIISTFTFDNLNDNQYYIDVRFRNCIQTWSASPVDFSNIGDINYDFTTSANMAYGNNQKQVGNAPLRFGMYSGDENQDGAVNLTDITNIYNNSTVFATGHLNSDLNGDNVTNLTDLVIVYNNSVDFVQAIVP